MDGNQMAIPTEELHATTKSVRKETGQASGGNDYQTTIANNQPEDTTINIIALEDIMGQKFKSVMDPEASKTSQFPQTKWPRIPKVPEILRHSSDLKKHFEPRMISIGPYHHGNQNLELAEMLKRRLTKQFIEDSGKLIQDLYKKILMEISELRDCYTTEHDDVELAWMMLVDGCSLLRFIRHTTDGTLKSLNIDYPTAIIIIQDLFLLENQLPFPVLELLLESRQWEIVSILDSLINWVTEIKPPDAKPVAGEKKPSHLLDLMRRRLLGEPRTTESRNDGWYLYRNVKELMATGIRFRPSKTSELRDVSFTSYGMLGYLNLPPLAIDRSSVPLTWNLIAYEMCPNMTPDSGIISYVSFLESLINNSDDVKELESARVLQNFYGSSEEVAQFFSSLSVNLAVRDFSACYDVSADIGAHVRRRYRNRMYIWMTQLLNTYFTSPWTAIALVAAILVLFLTGVQTFFTVFPRPTTPT